MNNMYKQFKAEMRVTVDSKFDYLDYKIGEGTYGVVYKATTKSDGKFYALKKIKGTMQTEGLSTSACREIALLREIRHENIIYAQEVFLNPRGRDVWLLFDYAEHDLYQIIDHYRDRRNKSHGQQIIFMEEHMIKSLLWQTLNGIHYLHSNWILHRDLKPANILVMGEGPEKGCVKIADLGMARFFNSPIKALADVDPVVVTIWYRAPELLLGAKHYTKAIDLWAIGCILGELVITKPIFLGEQVASTKENKSPIQTDQLDKIFQIMGYPNERDWPDIRHLPLYDQLPKYFLNPSHFDCTLQKFMQPFMKARQGPVTPLGLNLLAELLTMDPTKRITAEAALVSPYFKEEPIPTLNCFEHVKIEFPKRYPIRDDKDKAKTKTTRSEVPTVKPISHMPQGSYQSLMHGSVHSSSVSQSYMAQSSMYNSGAGSGGLGMGVGVGLGMHGNSSHGATGLGGLGASTSGGALHHHHHHHHHSTNAGSTAGSNSGSNSNNNSSNSNSSNNNNSSNRGRSRAAGLLTNVFTQQQQHQQQHQQSVASSYPSAPGYHPSGGLLPPPALPPGNYYTSSSSSGSMNSSNNPGGGGGSGTGQYQSNSQLGRRH